ncbi:MAG: NUDIX hydrolase [Deltaproteobacteria bacterium]|nr:NUDIX hydrolase [Deltaproteobacteria bacterium]
MNYCSNCGHSLTRRIPPGDDRHRNVCDACHLIHYENPKMVVGTLPIRGGKVLLCKRAIEPELGKWTLPAGYLEHGETVESGAIRETREEAGATVDIIQPYTLFNLALIGQVYFMFLARLSENKFSPGKESLDVRLFSEINIPWNDLAFIVVAKTLQHYFADRATGVFPFHMGDIEAKKGLRLQ